MAKARTRKAPKTTKRPAPVTPESRNVGSLATSWFWLPPRLRDLFGGFREPYSQHPVIFAAVSAIARNIAGVPLLVKRGDRRNGDSATVLNSGPWVDLVERPNPSMTRAQFHAAYVIWLSTTGECMIVKESETDKPVGPNDIPFELWPVNGKLFDPVFASQESRRIVAWEYTAPNTGKKLRYLPHQLIHLKYFNPYDPIRGLAPLEAAAVNARIDWEAMQFGAEFFQNGAIPGGIITTRPEQLLTPDQKREMRENIEDRHSGLGKRHRTMLLEGGMDYKQLSLTQRDMAFLETMGFDRDAILMVFGVDKAEVGLEQGQDMVTGQGADSSRRNFVERTLQPIMRLVEDTFWSSLFKPVEPNVWVEFDLASIEALKPNFDLQLQQAEKLRALGYTMNEANERLQLGMPDMGEEGNVRWTASGWEPLEFALEEPEEPDQFGLPGDEGGEGGKPAPKDGDDDPDAEDDDDSEEASIVSSNVRAWMADHDGETPDERQRAEIVAAVHALLRASTPERRRAQRRFEKLLRPLERAFLRKVRRHLMDVRASVLKRLPKLMRAVRTTEDSGEPFDSNAADRNLLNLTRPLYYEVIDRALEGFFEEAGGSFTFDSADPKVVEIVRSRAAKLVKVNESIKRQIRAVITEGVQNNATVSSIQDAIRKVLNMTAGRALRIARTETASAANEARFEGMRGEGIATAAWSTAQDEAVRSSHRAQDGVVRRAGDLFPNGLRFPGDPAGSASETINCRCVLVPEDIDRGAEPPSRRSPAITEARVRELVDAAVKAAGPQISVPVTVNTPERRQDAPVVNVTVPEREVKVENQVNVPEREVTVSAPVTINEGDVQVEVKGGAKKITFDESGGKITGADVEPKD